MGDWIRQVVEQMGYAGILALTFLENLIPPIPSELIMPLAGFVAANGEMNPFGAVVAGSIGSLAGTSIYYAVGRAVGTTRIRQWIQSHPKLSPLSEEDLEKATAWFDRRGRWALLICRFIPGVRTVISLPAGLCGTPIGPYLAYSAVGVIIWTAALTYAGMALGENYQEVERYLSPIALFVVAVAVGSFFWYRRRKN